MTSRELVVPLKVFVSGAGVPLNPSSSLFLPGSFLPEPLILSSSLQFSAKPLSLGGRSSSSWRKNQRLRAVHRAGGAARAAATTTPDDSVGLESLDSITIFTAQGEPVQFKDLWDRENGKVIVAFLRHFGCPFCWEFAAALRDAKPKIDAARFKLITIGVGSPEKAQVLAKRLPFPTENLYADPDRKAYKTLGLYHGLGHTFFNPFNAEAFGRLDVLAKTLKGYSFDAMVYNPEDVVQQGGVYVFEGTNLLYARKDEATGDHSNLDDILDSCCNIPSLA